MTQRRNVTAIAGERVRARRQAEGWSQLELSCRTGVTQSTISRVESGRLSLVQVGTLQRLALAFGVDPAELAQAF